MPLISLSLASFLKLNSFTIFGEEVPSSPLQEPPSTMWLNENNVQKVTLEAVEILGTKYDADSSSDRQKEAH